jgi:competence ComEA-like helix-hairpin-helix protein
MTVKPMMKSFIMTVVIGHLLHLPVAAQFEHRPLGAVPAVSGGGPHRFAADPWGAYGNPSFYAYFAVPVISLTHVPGRFGLEELRSSAATVLLPGNIATAALTAHRFGFELYRETTLSLSAARLFGDRLAGGIGIDWHTLSVARYGSAWTVGLTGGMTVKLTEDIYAGFSFINLNRPAIGEDRYLLPQVMIATASYRPHPLVMLTTEIRKDILHPAEIGIGVDYLVAEGFSIRAGVNENPAIAAGGFSVSKWNTEIAYGLQWHFELGQTHFITLSYIFDPGGRPESAPVGIRSASPDHSPTFSPTAMERPPVTPRHLLQPYEVDFLRFFNEADAGRLREIPGIGEVMAERILSFRDLHGEFEKPEDIMLVPGIGERTLETIVSYWRSHYR